MSRELERERQKNQELRMMLSKMEKENQMIQDFLSYISHEIRTPLNAIQGLTMLAANHAEKPELIKECMDDIMKSSDVLLALFDEILQVSRLKQGKLVPVYEKFSLHNMLEYYSGVIMGSVKEHGHHFTVETKDILHDEVMGDRRCLGQIFVNLVSNAVKYTPDGGKIYVELRELPEKQSGGFSYLLRVKDNGIGISKEFQKQMFEPFTRGADTKGRNISGTGLGLTIVRELLKQMKGKIDVNSDGDQGTEFILRFSLKEAGTGEAEKISGIQTF